jgi:hypothetical protein
MLNMGTYYDRSNATRIDIEYIIYIEYILLSHHWFQKAIFIAFHISKGLASIVVQ